jgi:hypothetical protein
MINVLYTHIRYMLSAGEEGTTFLSPPIAYCNS